MEKKERVLIRFRPEIYECFELEAAYEGLRVGTIANRLLISEIKKVARVGKGHCVVSGSEEDMAIPEGKKQEYYVLPAIASSSSSDILFSLASRALSTPRAIRSEERRVGKEC